MSRQQKRTTEQVEKWKTEIAALESARTKIQEAVVLQNVFETILSKSHVFFEDIYQRLTAFIECADGKRNIYIFVEKLQQISQLHDKEQVMVKLLLGNISWTNVVDTSTSYVRYYFPELSFHQTLDIHLPVLQITNPIESMIEMVLSYTILTDQNIAVCGDHLYLLGVQKFREASWQVTHYFDSKEDFDANPMSVLKIHFSEERADNVSFDILVFQVETSMSAIFPDPKQIWRFQNVLQEINQNEFEIDWIDHGFMYDEAITFPSDGVACFAFQTHPTLELDKVVPVQVTISKTYEILINQCSPTGTLETDVGDLPDSGIYTIESYMLLMNPVWQELVEKLKYFYKRITLKTEVNKTQNQLDLSNIQFIADLIKTQMDAKENGIHLFQSLIVKN